MAWKTRVEVDEGKVSVGDLIFDWYDSATDTEPSFSFSVRVDGKVAADIRKHARAAIDAKRAADARRTDAAAIEVKALNIINNIQATIDAGGA